MPIFPVNWLQGVHRWVDYTLPWSFYITGDVDTGKGGTSFALATQFIAAGGFVVDTFGSRNDSEPLSYFTKESPYRDEAAIVTGDDFNGSVPFHHFKISEFTIEKAKQFKVVSTDRIFFRDDVAHYVGLGRIFEVCRNRRGWKEEQGRPILALVVREAREVIRSQITSRMSKDEQEAEWVFVDLNAQRAHSGVAPIVDTQRWMDVHVTYRDLASFKILKGFGPQVIPSELDWLFKPILHLKWMQAPLKTRQPWPSYLRNMPVNQFVGITRWNSVLTGLVGPAPWAQHKGSDLAKILDIGVSFEGGKPEPTLNDKKALNERETHEIVIHKRVMELRSKGLTDAQIGAEIEKETGEPVPEYTVKKHRRGNCACRHNMWLAGMAE